MDYAIMSGGDVGPLGDDAVNQLHGLFRWAAKSRRGLLLFIDEAEAFLSSRASSGKDMGRSGSVLSTDSHLRHALNALLYQTGVQSTCFALVLATNRPEDLDSAILDRMDVSMHIGLPGNEERMLLVQQYFDVHVINFISKSTKAAHILNQFTKSLQYFVDDDCTRENMLKNIAFRLDGFSGREISKLFIAVRYALTLDGDRRLTISMIEEVCDIKIREHKQKLGFYDLSDSKRREEESQYINPKRSTSILQGNAKVGKDRSKGSL
jgi:ATPase family AAA domain-containing protein 3A/B